MVYPVTDNYFCAQFVSKVTQLVSKGYDMPNGELATVSYYVKIEPRTSLHATFFSGLSMFKGSSNTEPRFGNFIVRVMRVTRVFY